MGKFLNPRNDAFRQAIYDDIYVDKTMMIACMNKKIGKESSKYICVSRPRRFGKSMAANMLAAYYSRGCSSKELFLPCKISQDVSFEKYLNQYDVIQFDVQWCRGNVTSASDTVSYIQRIVLEELCAVYPEQMQNENGLRHSEINTLSEALALINSETGKQFILIIDEWDSIIRDDADDEQAQKRYIDFLRSLFKGNLPSSYLGLAYLTGILPIKKVKTQSALNNFEEFTMLDAGELAPYTGFTEEEVQDLCRKYGRNFADIQRWYDGYLLEENAVEKDHFEKNDFKRNLHIYNPRAVVSSILRGKLKSYWSMTGTYEMIIPWITMDFDGLKTDILKMLSGEKIRINTKSYQNDMVTFKNKHDVLTLLIHLGYLAYDEQTQEAFIPNEEIRSEFIEAVGDCCWDEFWKLQRESDELLKATLEMDSDAVARAIERAHEEYTSIIQYNDENALSCVISMAYFSALKYYYLPIREMPTGRGFADLVFLPKREFLNMPAMLIELKWDKTAKTAIQQIKDRHYVQALEVYAGDVLLIGINYNKKENRHECLMEKVIK